MALVPAFIRGIARWISYWLTSGHADRVTLEGIRQRMGEVTADDYALGVQEAVKGIEAVQRLWQLSTLDPLSAALGGEEPPAPMVDVRVVFRVEGQEAPHEFRSVYLEVPWTTTLSDLYRLAAQQAGEFGREH